MFGHIPVNINFSTPVYTVSTWGLRLNSTGFGLADLLGKS